MQNIKPFIDLGWNTVPIQGTLERLPNGEKTQPKFEKEWKKRYAVETNTKATKLGGVMTGAVSNCIAIDCDNTETYNLFKSLDPDYEFVFKSKGKKDKKTGESKICGTIMYLFDEAVSDTFSIADDDISLDVYSNHGFVYLPTDANTTKEAWPETVPQLQPMPATVRILLTQLKKKPKAEVTGVDLAQNSITANCLAPLIQQFVGGTEFMPGLFKIITPRAFRQEPQYVKQGFLHPENIPDGRGSEYLTKVSAILGADISINEDLYVQAMDKIHSLWPIPMDSNRFTATIIDPMLAGNSAIDGKPIWVYDENWKNHRLIMHTKRQSNIELGFDDRSDVYYCVDLANEHVKHFETDTNMHAYVGSIAYDAPSKAIMKRSIPLINVEVDPSKEFGFHAGSDPTARAFNSFIRTPELLILAEPDTYKPLYRRPTTILRYFEHLVPEEAMRTWLLKFLKRKLTTFDYSPAILYFLGVPGSGKDTFVSILATIMGSARVAKPTTKEFLEVYNSWVLDSTFVQLDEYGDQLSTARDKEEALGKLKAYSGKDTIRVRRMRTDGYEHKHMLTFVMTANKNPLMVDDGDRRIALFSTPTVFTETFNETDVETTRARLFDEVKDFCYFLATEVGDLASDQYQKPPESADKRRLIADSMRPTGRLAYCIKHGMLDYLTELAQDHGCDDVVTEINSGTLFTSAIEELYNVMTDYNGNLRTLNRDMKSFNVKISRTTRGGEQAWYYNIENLTKNDDCPFEPED